MTKTRIFKWGVTSSIFLMLAGGGWSISAQTTGAANSSSAAAAAPSGNQAVESVMVSNSAANEVGEQLAVRICTDAVRTNGRNFLLASPTNLASINAYLTFRTGAEELGDLYGALPAIAQGGRLEEFRAEVSPGASQAITAIAGAVNTAKTQTTETASTFAPVDQVLYSAVERSFNNLGCQLVTTAYPQQLAAAREEIRNALVGVRLARGTAYRNRQDGNVTNYGNDKELQALDTQLTTLEQTVGTGTANASGSGILLGAALIQSLTGAYDPTRGGYHVLTLVNSAAGGGTRANVYFLLNLLLPAPHPSYNGGAAASFSLRTCGGTFEDADTLYFVFGYTKWPQPPLRNQENAGFTNSAWNRSHNRGKWKPIY